MEAVKLEGTDCIAVAPGCFDLPLMQCVDLCPTCNGQNNLGGPVCAECDGIGVARTRLVTHWKFTPEEWQYMLDNPESRGVHLSVCAAQTPPVLITVQNPVDIWPDSVVPLKKFMQTTQS